MSTLNYTDFRKYATSFDFELRYELLLETIENHINTEEKLIFYPRNMFLKDSELEIYFFDNEKIFIINEDAAGVEIDILKTSSVDRVKLTSKDRYSPLNLTITLKDGEELIFNSSTDTVEGRMQTFNRKIEEIFKLLH